MKTVFIEASSDLDLIPAVEKNINSLRNYKKIGLISTIQHTVSLKEVEKYLKSKGKQIYIGKGSKNCKYAGQVLGCDTSCALEIEKKVDCFLYIGTGEFHPLGVFIKTNKPVFILNPFSKKIKQISEKERQTYEKKRIMILSKAKDANNYGILVSVKPGQYNLKKALEIKKNIEKKGKSAFIFLFDTLDSREFLNFRWIEAWINTSCPRIIDDKFEKPVINAEEFSI